MGQLKNKKGLKLTIDTELLEKVRPYINNLSAFMESCLRNFYRKNQRLIEDADIKTSRLLVEENISIDNAPNITYIMQHLPVQLALLPIVNDKVIGVENKKVINVPSIDNPIFLSNNSLQLKDKKYYFEIINNDIMELRKKQDEEIELKNPTWITKY